MSVCVCVSMYVSVCVCMYLCVFVCVYVYLCVCVVSICWWPVAVRVILCMRLEWILVVNLYIRMLVL